MSTKSPRERRDIQRESLRAQRQAELARQRRVRTLVISSITTVAIVLAAGIGYFIFRQAGDDVTVVAPGDIPADQAFYSLGAAEDSGKPVVELHVDFMCPFCGEFDRMHGEDLAEIVANEEASVHLYARRFLDPQSTSGDYSSRAANALACVYEDDPANTIAYQDVLFENQPKEGSAGLDDAELFEYAQQVGGSSNIQRCIDSKEYQPWVRDIAEPGASARAGSTPYVVVDGEEMDSTEWGEAGALRRSVEAASVSNSVSDSGQ